MPLGRFELPSQPSEGYILSIELQGLTHKNHIGFGGIWQPMRTKNAPMYRDAFCSVIATRAKKRPFRNQLGHSDIECPYGKEIKVEEIRAG